MLRTLGEMSELTKTNPVQTTINPGRRMVKVEMESEPQGQELDLDIEQVPEEGESVEVPMDHDDHQVSSTDHLHPSSEQPDTTVVTTTTIPTTPPSVVPVKQSVAVHQAPQKFQDVRVDNWGNYCLQRLQVMYDRGDFCDLTMQFHTNQLLKVHRVVVNLCTEYFANLERIFGLSDSVLVLPKDVEYQAMVTIVKFFYTGKLEIRGNQFNEVYRTVKLMNITILIKLLEAHAKKPVNVPTKKEPTRPIVFKQTVEIGRPLQKGQLSPGGGVQLSGTHVKFGGNTALAIQGAGGTKTLQVSTPGAKLPPGVTTKTVLARVQPQGVRMHHHHQGMGKIANQKKLPFWKERKFGPGSDPLMTERWPVKDEPARPTRFEWGDPDDDSISFNTGPVVSHTLMEKQKASGTMRKAEDIFDAVKTQTALGKRSAVVDAVKNSSPPEQPPPKISKVSPTSSNELIAQITHNENDDVNLTEDTVEEEVSTTEIAPPATLKKNATILKPALKSQLTRLTPMVGKNDPNLGDLDSPTASSSRIQLPHTKTVRFAPEIEKENSKNNDSHHHHEIITEEDVASNHSKIIAEVLKKYPDLVKDKQNIRLKIVQRGADASPSKDKSKVSYIVLKSTSSPESLGAVLLKKPNHTATNKAFWDAGVEKEKKPSGAENTAGPWLCGPCGGGDETPMSFESYYIYRRHLVEVHGERIDARICEYCGQKASKRNLLLYHLYTKHAKPPPTNIHFPNCDRCDYIALSESLLNKHKLTHDATKEYSCEICNASFKSSGALQGHMAANLHRNKETKVYECPYCRKPFVRNINLKGHIRALHRDIARIEEMDDPRLPNDDTSVHRTGALNSVNRKRQFPSILGSRTVPLEILPGDGSQGQQVSLVTADGHTIEIIHGLDPNSMSVPMTLVPSSEAEAMTNVASSIAASLGLEQGVHGTEFGDGSQAVYIMDNSQPAVEVDMSAMGLTADGTMIYDGEDPNGDGQFIVQDVHGNQFRKMTGIDETGKPVIFFQLSEEHSQIGPTILGEEIQMTSENSSVYVSSAMTVPVNVTSSSTQQTQVILTASGHDGDVFDLVPADQGQESHDQVIITPIPESEVDHDHEEVYEEETIHQHIDNSVQQLHIVLDHAENNDVEEQETSDLIGEHEDEYVHSEESIISGDTTHEEETNELDQDGSIMVIEEDSQHLEQDSETQEIDNGNPEEQETQIIGEVPDQQQVQDTKEKIVEVKTEQEIL